MKDDFSQSSAAHSLSRWGRVVAWFLFTNAGLCLALGLASGVAIELLGKTVRLNFVDFAIGALMLGTAQLVTIAVLQGLRSGNWSGRTERVVTARGYLPWRYWLGLVFFIFLALFKAAVGIWVLIASVQPDA